MQPPSSAGALTRQSPGSCFRVACVGRKRRGSAGPTCRGPATAPGCWYGSVARKPTRKAPPRTCATSSTEPPPQCGRFARRHPPMMRRCSAAWADSLGAAASPQPPGPRHRGADNRALKAPRARLRAHCPRRQHHRDEAPALHLVVHHSQSSSTASASRRSIVRSLAAAAHRGRCSSCSDTAIPLPHQLPHGLRHA